jgi:hypothetical protein
VSRFALRQGARPRRRRHSRRRLRAAAHGARACAATARRAQLCFTHSSPSPLLAAYTSLVLRTLHTAMAPPLSYDEKLARAAAHREAGNAAFVGGSAQGALKEYWCALLVSDEGVQLPRALLHAATGPSRRRQTQLRACWQAQLCTGSPLQREKCRSAALTHS